MQELGVSSPCLRTLTLTRHHRGSITPETYFPRFQSFDVTQDEQPSFRTRETNVQSSSIPQETNVASSVISNGTEDDDFFLPTFETVYGLHFDRRGLESTILPDRRREAFAVGRVVPE